MRILGKLLQVVGLVALPLSMIFELTGMLGRRFGLSQMVIMTVFGVCAFLLGRLLDGYAQRPDSGDSSE